MNLQPLTADQLLNTQSGVLNDYNFTFADNTFTVRNIPYNWNGLNPFDLLITFLVHGKWSIKLFNQMKLSEEFCQLLIYGEFLLGEVAGPPLHMLYSFITGPKFNPSNNNHFLIVLLSARILAAVAESSEVIANSKKFKVNKVKIEWKFPNAQDSTYANKPSVAGLVNSNVAMLTPPSAPPAESFM